MQTDIQVTAARLEDLGEIQDLLRRRNEEEGRGLIDEDLTSTVLYKLIQHELHGAIFVIRGPRRLEGAAGLMVQRWWDVDGPFLHELFRYVHPAHRRTDAAKVLIANSKRCASDLNMPLRAEVIESEKTAGAVKLCERSLEKAQPARVFFYNLHLIT